MEKCLTFGHQNKCHTLLVISAWTPSCRQGLSVWDSLPMALLVLRVINHWGSQCWSYTEIPKSLPGPSWGGAQWDPWAGWSPPWAQQSWAEPALHRVWLEEVRAGKAPASSTNPAVEFMNPKYTPLEAGEGIRILVVLGHDLFRLQKPRDDQGTGVWVTSRPVTTSKWSLFTSATK